MQSLLNISKVYLGMAILTCPRAMAHTGLGCGIIGIVFSGILNWYSIYLQAEARRKYMRIREQEAQLEFEAENQSATTEERSFWSEHSPIDDSRMSISTPKQSIRGYGDLGQASFGSYGYIIANVSSIIQQGG